MSATDTAIERPAAGAITGKYLYYGNLPTHERQFKSGKFIGLALTPQHRGEIRHDARQTLPVSDNSVLKIQSQDVFEHLPYESLPAIFDDIFRALAPGGIFRLSLPDYRSPFLTKRCVFDEQGNVLADLRMGGSVRFDRQTKKRKVEFLGDGNAHVWFPTYQSVSALVDRSDLRKCRKVTYYHYFIDSERYVTDPIPENEMFVMRAPPNDMRAGGRPISIVADFEK